MSVALSKYTKKKIQIILVQIGVPTAKRSAFMVWAYDWYILKEYPSKKEEFFEYHYREWQSHTTLILEELWGKYQDICLPK